MVCLVPSGSTATKGAIVVLANKKPPAAPDWSTLNLPEKVVSEANTLLLFNNLPSIQESLKNLFPSSSTILLFVPQLEASSKVHSLPISLAASFIDSCSKSSLYERISSFSLLSFVHPWTISPITDKVSTIIIALIILWSMSFLLKFI